MERGRQDLSRGLELLRRSADSTEAGEERRRITPVFLAQFLSVCGIELRFELLLLTKVVTNNALFLSDYFLITTCIFEKILPFICMALLLHTYLTYILLKPSSKLPFKMNAWNNEGEKILKTLNGINPEVQRNQVIVLNSLSWGGPELGFTNFIHTLFPKTGMQT